MAIIQETKTIRKRDFIHTYSDAGYTILQEETGIEYQEAYDVTAKTYTETGNLRPDATDEQKAADAAKKAAASATTATAETTAASGTSST